MPMDPRNLHNVSSRNKINVILDFKYVPNMCPTLFHKLDENNLASWSNNLMW